MKNIKKLLFTIAFFSILITPFFTSAATIEELQVQIQALLKQISQLQDQIAQIQGQPAQWCYDFNANLRIGDAGTAVCSLRTALQKEGFEAEIEKTEEGSCKFSEEMASAVSGLQQKYADEILKPLGLKYGTGFLGKSTRAKLNKLLGCGVKPVTPIPTIQTPVCNIFLTCEGGYISYNTGEKDSQGCPIIKCVSTPTPITTVPLISEQVKCVFYNSNSKQECYSSAGSSCAGTESCTTDVKGKKGEQITWKSSCGGYVYITMDGINEYAEFSCAPVSCPLYSLPICKEGEKIVSEGKDADGCQLPGRCVAITGNQPPAISGVSGPTTLKINETGTWTVKASDPENGMLSYYVVWGDEASRNLPASVSTYGGTNYSQSTTFTHSYASAGVYYPTFTVTDSQGLSAKTSISVNVGENIPICSDGIHKVGESWKSSDGCNTCSCTTDGKVACTLMACPASFITVLSPNGGETWVKGSTQILQWKSSSDITSVYMKLRKGSDTYPGPEGVVTPSVSNAGTNPGSHQWTIPTTLPDGNDYSIRIVDSTGRVYDDSDALFSIVTMVSQNHPPEITGGSTLPPSALQAGQTVNFSWYAQDDDKDNLVWQVNWGDGIGMAGACFQQSIYGQGWTFNSSHAWAQAGTYTVKITVSDCKGGTDSLSLTINVGAAVTPSVTILSPNGGESWTFGNIYGITWKSSGVKNASVYLWFSDGTTCKLADVPAENGKYSVQFAENQLCTTQNISIKVTAGRYRIKIYTENGKVDDSSDNYFSIISSGTGLMDTENMLASISQAVSQIAERIKELMGR